MTETPVLPERSLVIAAASRHFLPFVKVTFPRYEVNAVSHLVAKELAQFEADVAAGKSPRVILELPPRVGKSELVSRRFPPFLLGRHPHWRIGLVSYGADLAESLSRDARAIMLSEEYADIFARYDTEEVESVEIDKTAKAVHEWRLKPTKDNPQPGGMTATGLSGTLTGKGFNVLVIDDPHKNWDEANSRAAKERVWSFYSGTLYDRLEPGAGILVVMQRWAVDDLVGRLTAARDEVDEEGFEVDYLDRWKVIRVPAQAEAGDEDPLGRQPGEWLKARYTVQQWERAKANNLLRNPRIWYAKFQQRPTPAEGFFFQPREDVRFEDEDEFENEGPIFIFGDTSYAKGKNSDFSCFGVWRYERRRVRAERNRGAVSVDETFRLLEVYRKRVQFPQLKLDLIDLAAKHGVFVSEVDNPWQGLRPRIFIEDYGSGTSLIQEFMHPVGHPRFGLIRLPVQAWRPLRDRDKDARAYAVTPYFAEGKVAMPKKAPWLPHLIQTLTEFQGEGSIQYDDEIDMVSMSLIRMGVEKPADRALPREMPFRIVA